MIVNILYCILYITHIDLQIILQNIHTGICVILNYFHEQHYLLKL